MKEQDVAKLDQLTTDICRTYPNMLFSFYKSLESEGFSENQAFQLTLKWFEGMIRTR